MFRLSFLCIVGSHRFFRDFPRPPFSLFPSQLFVIGIALQKAKVVVRVDCTSHPDVDHVLSDFFDLERKLRPLAPDLVLRQ